MNGYVALMILPVLVVLGILLFGVISFARGGPWYERNSNRLMRMRVAGQFIAVVLVILLAWLARG